MSSWEVILLVLLVSSAASSCDGKSRTRGVVSDEYHIDCGAPNRTLSDYGLVEWDTDDKFIKTGQNYLLTDSHNLNPMNSLRYFPTSLRNCYKLQFPHTNTKVIFLAGFFYGNYDGFSRPPSFDLEIDGNLWATVTTSLNGDEPVYYELIYWVKGDTTQVCLVRTNTNEVPFISTLEARLMYDEMYKMMENGTALHLISRTNFGANKSIEKFITPFDESYMRIWKSQEMSEYLNINAGVISNVSFLEENEPPIPVMEFAIQAKNSSDSIYLTLDFNTQTSSIAYLVFYFMDPLHRFPPNQTSKVEILVDGAILGATDVPDAIRRTDEYHVVSLYPVQVESSVNVTIAPAEGSTLAPLLNAMEVFYVTSVSKAGCLAKSFNLIWFNFSSILFGIIVPNMKFVITTIDACERL